MRISAAIPKKSGGSQLQYSAAKGNIKWSVVYYGVCRIFFIVFIFLSWIHYVISGFLI
jgi:hypothetical protein